MDPGIIERAGLKTFNLRENLQGRMQFFYFDKFKEKHLLKWGRGRDETPPLWSSPKSAPETDVLSLQSPTPAGARPATTASYNWREMLGFLYSSDARACSNCTQEPITCCTARILSFKFSRIQNQIKVSPQVSVKI